MGIPELVGSGLGVPFATATKVTKAITITAARTLTIIHGSLEAERVGLLGVDTRTPHRNGLRSDADRTKSLSRTSRLLNGGARAPLGGATIIRRSRIHHATAQDYLSACDLFKGVRCGKAIDNRHESSTTVRTCG